MQPFPDHMISTAFTLPGYRIVRNLGVVRGLTVRSRSIVGNLFGSLQTLLGGNITIYTQLCERARADTYRLMCEHARQQGANAVIGMRYARCWWRPRARAPEGYLAAPASATSFFSSPLLYISSAMSQPPTSSPLTYSCG